MKHVMILALTLAATPAQAHTYSALANPQIPLAAPLAEVEEAPAPAGTRAAEYVAPSKDVPLYVPLTDAEAELPTVMPDPGEDYYPGIERPATAPAAKGIVDRVPQ